MNELDQVNEEHRFPCPVCGADLRFDPEDMALACDHCGHKEIIANAPSQMHREELDLAAALQQLLPETAFETIRYSHCNNCGANIEFSPEVHAQECPYCASPVVLDTGAERQIKPRGVLPFAFDEKTGKKFLVKWIGSRWFAPNALREYARKGRPLAGMYMPYWTYDAQTVTTYSGRRGDIYYVTVGHGDNQRREARIRWSRASGRVSRFFDDILVLGSHSLPKSYTDNLAPWDLTALEPYNPEYLAGYRSESYTVPLEDGWREANDVMKATIIRDIKFDIGGDRQQITNMDTQISKPSFKHILMPVYSAAYKFRGKTYRCLINGRTGKVQGERPYSFWKIFFAVLFAVILIFTIAYFLRDAEFTVNVGY